MVPEAADLVRLIYQKYLEADMKREDKVITSDFVSSVLGNPVYYGMIVYNRRTNSEEIKRNPNGSEQRTESRRKASGSRDPSYNLQNFIVKLLSENILIYHNSVQ